LWSTVHQGGLWGRRDGRRGGDLEWRRVVGIARMIGYAYSRTTGIDTFTSEEYFFSGARHPRLV
jgi:hypothetical protein